MIRKALSWLIPNDSNGRKMSLAQHVLEIFAAFFRDRYFVFFMKDWSENHNSFFKRTQSVTEPATRTILGEQINAGFTLRSPAAQLASSTGDIFVNR
jgi:hypothetical protein